MNVKGNEDAVAATLADPQYKAGRKLIDNGRLEEAVNFFGGLLETRVAVHDGDEMNPALAPLYYEYGNSLLYNAEESGAIFGDAVTEAEKKRAMAIVEAQITGATGNVGGVDEDVNDGGAGADLADEEEAPSPDQGTEEDLEVAWENLEMARRIYSELELKDEIRAAIAKVHLRLGDLNMVNGMYNEAAEEFEKCLVHRLALPRPGESRAMADAHVCKAQALFYASTLEGAEKDALVTRSLEQYRMAAKIFEAMLALSKKLAESEPPPPKSPAEKENGNGGNAENEGERDSGKTTDNGKGKSRSKHVEDSKEPSPSGAFAARGSEKELLDTLDAIRETIDTMMSGKDMEALAEYKSGTASTTIGFGDSSSSCSAGAANGGVAGSTTVGFGGSGGKSTGNGNPEAGVAGGSNGASSGFSSAVEGAGAAAANTMVVKRKGRPVPKAVQNGDGENVVDGENSSSKKPKIGE